MLHGIAGVGYLVTKINECSKLAQREYKTRYDWVGMVIHGEVCKGLLFDHADKWYRQKQESILKNET